MKMSSQKKKWRTNRMEMKMRWKIREKMFSDDDTESTRNFLPLSPSNNPN